MRDRSPHWHHSGDKSIVDFAQPTAFDVSHERLQLERHRLFGDTLARMFFQSRFAWTTFVLLSSRACSTAGQEVEGDNKGDNIYIIV